MLGGVEIQLYRLFRPLDELIQALCLGVASGEGGDGGDVGHPRPAQRGR